MPLHLTHSLASDVSFSPLSNEQLQNMFDSQFGNEQPQRGDFFIRECSVPFV